MSEGIMVATCKTDAAFASHIENFLSIIKEYLKLQ